jgi:hypothetical protein
MDKRYTTTELYDWFTQKQRSATTMRRYLLGHNSQQKFSETLGKLYFFVYDPKHKATLPIYDRFPLVFPIESYPDGFLGLNIHYLGMGMRMALFSKLKDYATSNVYTDRTRLTLTYSLLQQSRSLSSLGQPCIKRYLYSHVMSYFIEVPATEWDRAYQLPVESFVVRK